MKTVLKIGLILSFVFSGTIYASDKPLAFFQNYIQLGEAFDPEIGIQGTQYLIMV